MIEVQSRTSCEDLLKEKDKEIKDLKKQLEEEKNAYNRMYNMYVEKDNIINELEKAFKSDIEHLDKQDKDADMKIFTVIGVCQYYLDRARQLKDSDKE